MKRSWLSKMQRLGRDTGYGMRFCVRMAREQAASKARTRMAIEYGEPERLLDGYDVMLRPVRNKRSGKIISYEMVLL